MIPFIRLIRFPNLLIIVLAQWLCKYYIIDAFIPAGAMTDLQFWLLVLATVCIAAGGNVINDIFDVKVDLINKPEKVIVTKQISEQVAYNLYIGLNIVGVGIGLYLANAIGKSSFATLFVLISGALYIYASSLKRKAVIGNIVISLLVALSLLIVGLFDIASIAANENKIIVSLTFKLLAVYAFFAFAINWLREMVKDIEDIDGDHTVGMRTLPILLGRKRTAKMISVLAIICMAGIFWILYTYLHTNQWAIAYGLLALLGPMMYFAIKVWSAETKKDFRLLSSLLKIIMVLGLLSMPIFSYLFNLK